MILAQLSINLYNIQLSWEKVLIYQQSIYIRFDPRIKTAHVNHVFECFFNMFKHTKIHILNLQRIFLNI